MKNKWNLIASVFQLVIGIVAILAFVFVGLSGENMAKWIVTLILSIAFVVLGIIEIFKYRSTK
ncbi:MAG: hypothetical protein UHK60_04570 [Acutalibacteraceae bacterium]|nr:hypothetical protein [Acutalibacteraceae bacterium]